MSKCDKDTLRLIGNRVTESRKINNLTEEELAAKMGVSTNTVSSIENGSDFRVDKLFCLTEALGVSSDYLLFGKPFDSQDEKNPVSDSEVVEAVLIKRSDWEKLQQLKEGGMLISVSKMMGENKKKKDC